MSLLSNLSPLKLNEITRIKNTKTTYVSYLCKNLWRAIRLALGSLGFALNAVFPNHFLRYGPSTVRKMYKELNRDNYELRKVYMKESPIGTEMQDLATQGLQSEKDE